MNIERSWGKGLMVYAIYRRTLSRVGGKRGNPARVLLVKIAIILLAMPLMAPILWHALLTMPAALAVFIAVSMRLPTLACRAGRSHSVAITADATPHLRRHDAGRGSSEEDLSVRPAYARPNGR
jgi:hypothetical protein